MPSERLVATWEASPYTGIKKRHIAVKHRILVESHPGVGCDVRHEIRCELRGVDDWTPVEVYEVRDHGVTVVEGDAEGVAP